MATKSSGRSRARTAPIAEETISRLALETYASLHPADQAEISPAALEVFTMLEREVEREREAKVDRAGAYFLRPMPKKARGGEQTIVVHDGPAGVHVALSDANATTKDWANHVAHVACLICAEVADFHGVSPKEVAGKEFLPAIVNQLLRQL